MTSPDTDRLPYLTRQDFLKLGEVAGAVVAWPFPNLALHSRPPEAPIYREPTELVSPGIERDLASSIPSEEGDLAGPLRIRIPPTEKLSFDVYVPVQHPGLTHVQAGIEDARSGLEGAMSYFSIEQALVALRTLETGNSIYPFTLKRLPEWLTSKNQTNANRMALRLIEGDLIINAVQINPGYAELLIFGTVQAEAPFAVLRKTWFGDMVPELNDSKAYPYDPPREVPCVISIPSEHLVGNSIWRGGHRVEFPYYGWTSARLTNLMLGINTKSPLWSPDKTSALYAVAWPRRFAGSFAEKSGKTSIKIENLLNSMPADGPQYITAWARRAVPRPSAYNYSATEKAYREQGLVLDVPIGTIFIIESLFMLPNGEPVAVVRAVGSCAPGELRRRGLALNEYNAPLRRQYYPRLVESDGQYLETYMKLLKQKNPNLSEGMMTEIAGLGFNGFTTTFLVSLYDIQVPIAEAT